MKINETEKLAKISYQLNESKSKCIITQPTKSLSKVILRSTRKRFHHCKSKKKNRRTTSFYFKGAFYSQVWNNFWQAESPLKMMKNAFYFTSRALFVLKIFRFLSWLLGNVSKRLNQKDKLNFKFCDVTAWLINNCNTHIAQYLEK